MGEDSSARTTEGVMLILRPIIDVLIRRFGSERARELVQQAFDRAGVQTVITLPDNRPS